MKKDIKKKKPEALDLVRHKKEGITGVVNSNYSIAGEDWLDVETSPQNIKYRTKAEFWEVVEIGDGNE